MFRNISLLRFLVWLEVGVAGRRIFTKSTTKCLGMFGLGKNTTKPNKGSTICNCKLIRPMPRSFGLSILLLHFLHPLNLWGETLQKLTSTPLTFSMATQPENMAHDLCTLWKTLLWILGDNDVSAIIDVSSIVNKRTTGVEGALTTWGGCMHGGRGLWKTLYFPLPSAVNRNYSKK